MGGEESEADGIKGVKYVVKLIFLKIKQYKDKFHNICPPTHTLTPNLYPPTLPLFACSSIRMFVFSFFPPLFLPHIRLINKGFWLYL